MDKPDGVGIVKFYRPATQDGTGRWSGNFGFIAREGEPDLFFHIKSGYSPTVEDFGQTREARLNGQLSRDPRKGDKVVFWIGEDWRSGKAEAREWAFEEEVRIAEEQAAKPILFRVVKTMIFRNDPEHPRDTTVWQGNDIKELEAKFPRKMDETDTLKPVSFKDFETAVYFERQNLAGEWIEDHDWRGITPDPIRARGQARLNQTISRAEALRTSPLARAALIATILSQTPGGRATLALAAELAMERIRRRSMNLG